MRSFRLCNLFYKISFVVTYILFFIVLAISIPFLIQLSLINGEDYKGFEAISRYTSIALLLLIPLSVVLSVYGVIKFEIDKMIGYIRFFLLMIVFVIAFAFVILKSMGILLF